jgi:hypothetical protein
LTVAVFATGMLFQGQKQAASPASAEKKQEAASNSHKSESPDAELTGPTWLTKDAAGFFTFGLVLVGVGQAWLFFFQLRYMRIGMRDATVAANAAKDSSVGVVAAERARFFIVIQDHNIGDLLRLFTNTETDLIHRTVGRSTPPEITYRFKNYGKTPGILKEISLGMSISSDPVDPVYSVTISSFPEHMIGAGDATPDRYAEHYSPIVSEQASAIDRNVARLWFYGRLDYEDVFGKPQVHRFYFRTVKYERRLILQPYDYKHYNQFLAAMALT